MLINNKFTNISLTHTGETEQDDHTFNIDIKISNGSSSWWIYRKIRRYLGSNLRKIGLISDS